MEKASLEPDGTVPLGIRHTPETITSGDIPYKSLISRPRSVSSTIDAHLPIFDHHYFWLLRGHCGLVSPHIGKFAEVSMERMEVYYELEGLRV